MIQPGRLKHIPHAEEIPYSVIQANVSHQAFVAASSFAAKSIGVTFLEAVSGDTITAGFFRQMLQYGGTNRDVKWLLKNAVIEFSDVRLWVSAVKEYSARALS